MHGGEEVALAAHVQKSLLLAGEGCLGQVLGGGGGAHRDGELAALAHLVPGLEHLLVEARRKRGFQHPAANLLAHLRQPLDVIHVEWRQRGANPLVQPALGQKIAIGVCRGGKPAGHRHPEARQARNHLADRSIFAADQLDVFILEFLERDDVWLHN